MMLTNENAKVGLVSVDGTWTAPHLVLMCRSVDQGMKLKVSSEYQLGFSVKFVSLSRC